jgi:hypothetical protein
VLSASNPGWPWWFVNNKTLLIAGHAIIALLLDGYDQNVGILSLLVNRTVLPVCNLNSRKKRRGSVVDPDWFQR